MASHSFVGKPTPLLDGRAKVTGSTRFTPDLTMPGLLHARFLTSPYAHAAIRGIDAAAALAVPGVVAVLTAADMPNIVPSSRTRLLLARDRVIFVGQPVALVLAIGEGEAEDGLGKIQVDYDPLPAVISIDAALEPDAPLLWRNGVPSGSDNASMHGVRPARWETALTITWNSFPGETRGGGNFKP